MREYEIRVLNNGRTSAVYEVVHLSDHAAIRAAQNFSGGLPFEVWRGLDCIYETPRTDLAPRANHALSL